MDAAALALTGAALQGEWWRLWSGHVVHYSLGHAVLNAAAATPPLLLSRARSLSVAWLFVTAPLLSIALLFFERFDEYRGASGLIVGLWFVVAGEMLLRGERKVGALVATGVILKLIAETCALLPWRTEVVPSTAAHWWGAMLGVGSVLIAATFRRARPAPYRSATNA